MKFGFTSSSLKIETPTAFMLSHPTRWDKLEDGYVSPLIPWLPLCGKWEWALGPPCACSMSETHFRRTSFLDTILTFSHLVRSFVWFGIQGLRVFLCWCRSEFIRAETYVYKVCLLPTSPPGIQGVEILLSGSFFFSLAHHAWSCCSFGIQKQCVWPVVPSYDSPLTLPPRRFPNRLAIAHGCVNAC